MAQPSPRRTFLKTCAASSVGYWVAGGVRAAESTSPNEKIRIASFGVGGKGTSDIASVQRAGADIVALCDIDDRSLRAIQKLLRQHSHCGQTSR